MLSEIRGTPFEMAFEVSLISTTQMRKTDSVLIGGTPSVTSFAVIRARKRANRISLTKDKRTRLAMLHIGNVRRCETFPAWTRACLMSFATPLEVTWR